MYVHTDRGEMRKIEPVVSIVILDKLLKPKRMKIKPRQSRKIKGENFNRFSVDE